MGDLEKAFRYMVKVVAFFAILYAIVNGVIIFLE